MDKMTRKRIIFVLLFSVISLVFIVYFKLYDISILRKLIESRGILTPIIFLILCSIRPLLFLPVGIFSTLGGLIFGAFLGTVYTLIGSILSSILGYYIARKFGKDLVDKLLKGRYKNIRLTSNKNGFIVTFIMRVVPILPFDAVSYICGLSEIRFKDYFLGTFLGIIPGTFIYSYFGSAVNNVYSKKFLISLFLLILLSLIPLIFKNSNIILQIQNKDKLD